MPDKTGTIPERREGQLRRAVAHVSREVQHLAYSVVNSIVDVRKQKGVNMQDGRANNLKEERAMLKGLLHRVIDDWLSTTGHPAFDGTLGETRSDRIPVRVPVDKLRVLGYHDL
jgi:hypothetical protein